MGEAFFYSLVEYIATVLGMDFALIGLKIPETGQVRTIAIYEDLLAISRADSGTIPINSQRVDLDRIGRELIEEIQVALGSERIFTLSMGNMPNLVSLDEKFLRRILTNLLYNAVKYSAKDSCINFSIDSQENQIIFTIADAGIGILSEDRIHIFEPFYQGRNANNIPGTGLGLNIAKKYVELLGGTISFTSQVGIGSIFVVTLPYQDF